MTNNTAKEVSVDIVSDEELNRLRRTNLGRLLDEVHVGFDQLALSYFKEAGYESLTAAHTHVLRTMSLEGASVTEMAERAGISKQAMSKLVAAFEREGFVEWRSRGSGASRFVFATEAGRKLLAVGIRALQRAEDDYFSALSLADREQLRALLLEAAESNGRGRSNEWRRRRA